MNKVTREGNEGRADPRDGKRKRERERESLCVCVRESEGIKIIMRKDE